VTNSRSKGKRGELEIAAYLRARGHEARRGQQFSGGTDSPDVVSSIAGVHLEVKRVETFNAYKALAQAINDAGQKMPVVIHKRNRQDWIAVLRLDDLMTLIEGHIF
jgi:Holliday junction resolvase